MNRHSKTFLLSCLILTLSSRALAAPPRSSVLGNSGQIYTVQAGVYGDLFPGATSFPVDLPLVVLDFTRPGEASERLIVPTTAGVEVEGSPGLIYSQETGLLNVVWESQLDDELSLFLARFDGTTWSQIDEIYFHPEGVRPAVAVTHDAFQLDLDGADPLAVERHVLHLVWPQEADGSTQIEYSPILILSGEFIGSTEVLSLTHLNADANSAVDTRMPPFLRVAAKDDVIDSITLTFGSAASGVVSSLEIETLPIEFVHLGDLIRDLVTDSGFDPRQLSRFAGEMGIELIDAGARSRRHSRSILSPALLDYVASGVTRYILDAGADYGADEVEALAADLRLHVLDLATSLFSPVPAAAPKSGGSPSILEIDVGGLLGEEDPMPAHVLELGLTVERSLPDTGGRRLTIYTSDDGMDFLGSWKDSENRIWFVESRFEDSGWSEPRYLQLSEKLSLADAQELLRQRIR